jgi:hypothetical protein
MSFDHCHPCHPPRFGLRPGKDEHAAGSRKEKYPMPTLLSSALLKKSHDTRPPLSVIPLQRFRIIISASSSPATADVATVQDNNLMHQILLRWLSGPELFSRVHDLLPSSSPCTMDLITQKTQCFQMTKDQMNDIEGTYIENTRTFIQLAVNVAPNHVLVVSENDVVCLYCTVFDDTVERCRMHQTALLEACSRWLQTLGFF